MVYPGHIHGVEQNPSRLSHYKNYFNELDIVGFQFPLKFSDTPKFENLNPSISVNVLVFDNNEVFPLYASKHRDRKHHVNFLMISNNEGKFHYLLVRNLSALVYGRTNHQHRTTVCPYCLYSSRRSGCSPIICLIVPSIPSRKWSTSHSTIRRKI